MQSRIIDSGESPVRTTRIRKFNSFSENPAVTRDPLSNPLYGDVVEGMDGERRFVEIRQRNRTRDVHYRCAGASSTQAISSFPLKCTISDWRRWARGGRVLCTTPARTCFDSISRRPVFAAGHSVGAAP